MTFRWRSANWRSGLYLRPELFHGERFALEERLRWLARHAVPGYGLVPTGGGGDALRFEASLSEDRRRFGVTVSRCLAIAPDGSPIHIDSLLPVEDGGTPRVPSGEIQIPAGTSGVPIHVFLEAPGPRVIAYGEVEQEQPTGQQWCFPAYRVLCFEDVPAGEDSLLEIGRFVVREDGYTPDKNFIPPCLTVGSYETLRSNVRELTALLHQCRDAAVVFSGRLVENRSKDLSSQVVATQLALLASTLASRLGDAGDWLSPMELVAAGREFVRCVWTLIETQPQVRDGAWSLFLSTHGGERCADHARFRNHLSDVLAKAIEPHPIHLTLMPTVALVRLVSQFGHYLSKTDVRDDTVVGPTLDYQDEIYIRQPYTSLEYLPATRSMEIRGLPALRGGRLLLWLSIHDPDERAQASSIKVGDSPAVPEMRRWPVDMQAHAPAVIIAMDMDPLNPVERLFFGSTHVNLDRLSKGRDEDIQVYHREEV